MKNKIKIFGILGLIIAIIIACYFIKIKLEKKTADFKTGVVETGSIKILVSSTGTINAKKTVDVGTQVSGTITKIYVNNNDFVKKDQILAVLDRKLLEVSVKTAEADLLKATSQYQLALQDYNNNIELNKENLVSNVELERLKVTKDAAYAGKLSAESNLLRANINLDYSVIKSPIDGIVIDKSIEEGQTISASTSAPTLFTIAQDLSSIEITALVTESDIGQIKKGQKCEFTVEAYPDESFEGEVSNVLLKSTVQSNVVNYSVMVNAINKNAMLLPGMTATIDIVISESNNILKVPNSALNYNPTEEMIMKVRNESMNDGEFGSRMPGDIGKEPSENSPFKRDKKPDDKEIKLRMKTFGRLWLVDEKGVLSVIPVKKGLTDGQNTEVTGELLKEGQKLIIGSNSASSVKVKTTNNNQANGHRPPPMGMF